MLLDRINSPIFNRNDNAQQDLLLIYTWKGLFHYIIYEAFGAATVLCWGFTPIVDLISGRSRKLPLEAWYPYNTTNTPAFELTTTYQASSVIWASTHNIAIDTFITGLITVACCQLAILERNIVSIDNEKNIRDVQRDKNTEETEYQAYQQLKRCAVHSNLIFR